MKKQKGSYTLEAVIVMTTIIMIIFAIISAFMLLYQNVVMYYVASKAAQEGAVMWADSSHDLDGNSSGVDDQGLYYRLGDFAGGDSAKEKRIEDWVKSELSRLMPGTLVGSGKETVNVDLVIQAPIRRCVQVSITKEVDIPFREVAQYFDQDLDMNVTVEAAVSEPAEYIRNIDYSVELVQEVWKMISGGLEKLFKNAK